jgi:hypothetical protein
MSTGLPPIPGATRNSRSAGEKKKGVGIGENPFHLPSDDQIFRMREEERKKKEDAKVRNQTMPIWHRANLGETSTTRRLQEILGDEHIITLKEAVKAHSETQKVSLPRRQEKESTAEFVSKKREMFLVQMSLDTKREEIRKLEEKAQMKEEALTRSEQMLEEDTMRFDAFLKENDAKAHAAIKKAEEETKRKQEKVQEIKRLTQQIQALNSEMTKHSDALADCLKYKAFLDMLTPPEWFEQHRERREKKIQSMKQQQFDAKYKEWDRMRRRLMEQHRKETEQRKEQKKDKNRKAGRSGAADDDEDDEPETKLVIPPPPRIEDEVVDFPEEEVPMYFKDPQQLMDIYSLLEEQNLFLIQNSQIAERTLEALEHDLKETEVQMNDQTKVLQEQIDDLKRQIEDEDQRITLLLAKRAAANEAEVSNNLAELQKKKDASGKLHSTEANAANNAGGPSQVEKEKLLSELNQVVRRVYEMCGFDASSKPETLSMLSQLESKLELLLQDIEKLPLEYVLKSEREKEKKRRERKREEQQALQERQQEIRNQRAIERSMQAPKKRIGRQVMYRSRPQRAEEKKQEEDDGRDNTDEVKYLS